MNTSQYLKLFIEETTENLQLMNESLLNLEEDPKNEKTLDNIFRVAHTVKGIAGTMGFKRLVELTHKIEDMFARIKGKELLVDKPIISLLFSSIDTIEKIIILIEEKGTDEIDISNLINDLDNYINTFKIKRNETKLEDALIQKNLSFNNAEKSIITEALKDSYNILNIEVGLSVKTSLKAARAFLIIRELEKFGEIIKSIPEINDIENEKFEFKLIFILVTLATRDIVARKIGGISEVETVSVQYIDKEDINILTEVQLKENYHEEYTDENSTKPIKEHNGLDINKKAYRSVKVELKKVDELMTMVSELVIYRTQLEEIASVGASKSFLDILEQIRRTTTELQEIVMKIRMLPLDVVFNRFPRMIRDLSVELKKDMELVIEGGDIELDRTVIDELSEPLVHLLRNAADHGIEELNTRLSRGKNKKGMIKISAFQQGTRVVIKVSDDGNGLDIDKIKIKASKLGISFDAEDQEELKNLIFGNGLSTSDNITDVSGRGIGMDIVKEKIVSFGGNLKIETKKNYGTTFTIELPLTLQIIQGLLFRCGNQTFVVSLNFIEKILEREDVDIQIVDGREIFAYEDKIINLVRLTERLNMFKNTNSQEAILIVKIGERIFGVLVEDLIGQQEVVIKSINKGFVSLNEYLGATILGDGKVALILDLSVL